MQKNVGKTDKTFRLVLAIALFLIGLFADIGSGVKVFVFLFSAIALLTALIRICPLYSVLGIDTMEKK